MHTIAEYCTGRAGKAMLYLAVAMRTAIVSIRTRLLLSFLALLAVPILTLGIVSPLMFARAAEAREADHTLRMIAQVDKNLEDHVRSVERLMALTALEPSVAAFFAGRPGAADEARAQGFMAACVATHPELAGMLLASADDRLLSGFYDRIARDPLTLESWYLKAAGRRDELTVVARPIGRNIRSRRDFGADDVVSLARAVDDTATHRTLGVILVDLRLDRLEELLADSSLGRSGFLYIADADGELVYAPVSRIVYRVPPALLTGSEGSKLLDLGGETYRVMYKKSAYTEWRTVGVFSRRETQREADLLRGYALVVAGVTIAFAVVLAVIFSSSIARPVTRLRKLMKRAELGDFGSRFEDDRGDEIGQLGRSYNAMVVEIRNLIAQVYQEQQRKREAELRVLQEQIKPHFLYNTLDAIQWMAQDRGAKDIVNIVSALTKLFRVGLSRGREIIPVQDEIEHAESYLRIQKVRYEDKFDYAIHVGEGLESCRVLKLVVQPLVENALYHGVKERRGPGRIDVRVFRDADCLTIVVQDDGIGMAPEALAALRASLDAALRPEAAPGAPGGRADGDAGTAERTGFGARNVHERIRLNFGDRYGLSYASERGAGTTVTVRHPIVEED